MKLFPSDLVRDTAFLCTTAIVTEDLSISMTLSQRLLKYLEPEGAVKTLRRFILPGNCSWTQGFVVDVAFEIIDPVGDSGLANKDNADNVLRLDSVVLIEVEPADLPGRVFKGLRGGEEDRWLCVVVPLKVGLMIFCIFSGVMIGNSVIEGSEQE